MNYFLKKIQRFKRIIGIKYVYSWGIQSFVTV